MKQIRLFLCVFVCALLVFTAVSAQDCESPVCATEIPADVRGVLEKLPQEFTLNLYQADYSVPDHMRYYRFPKHVWYYDHIGLSYFPNELMSSIDWTFKENGRFFESTNKFTYSDWAVLGRGSSRNTYKQQIYLDAPYERDIYHGTALDNAEYLNDFYLYADFYVTDNYPKNTGSCYLYYSDSVLSGYGDSHGILIDPRSGIYSGFNNYDAYENIPNTEDFAGLYIFGSEKHTLDQIEPLDASVYDGKSGAVVDELFPDAHINKKFTDDWTALTAQKDFSILSDPVVYRMELVRLSGKISLFINGVFVTTFEEEGPLARNMVSWTFGPVLYSGGETVSCQIGNLLIYARNEAEVK